MQSTKVFLNFKEVKSVKLQKAIFEGKDVFLTLPNMKCNFNLKEYRNHKVQIPTIALKKSLDQKIDEICEFLENLQIS